VALEVRERDRANGHEHGPSELSDQGVRLGRRRRDADRRVRLLERLGHDADVLELEVLALVREALLRPRRGEDVERLEEPVTAFAVRNVGALIVAGQAAAAHPELEPSLAEMVDRRDVLGQAQGWLSGRTWTAMPILTRRVHAASAAAITRGDASTDRSFWKWISASQTASKPRSSAAFIWPSDSSNGGGVAHPRRARELREQAEFHPGLPLKFEISYA